MAKIAEGRRALERIKELEAENADLRRQLAELKPLRPAAPRKSTKN